MARPRELVPGNCYFTVTYHDADLLVPCVQTLVYRGDDAFEDGRRAWLFDSPGDDGIPLGFSDEQLDWVLDLAGLQASLATLAHDHPLAPPGKPHAPIGMSEAARHELRMRVEAFAADPDARALTVTVLFTDVAVSLGRGPDGRLEIGFFTHPRRDDEDERLIRLFAGAAVSPHVDYLADRGRTRVLEFAPAFASLDDVVGLCERILTEIHAMRADDCLTFHMIGADSSSKET